MGNISSEPVNNRDSKSLIASSKMSCRSSPSRNSPSRNSPSRNSPSRNSPSRSSPSRSSPSRSSPSRSSPSRSSPSRSSPSRSSPSRSSLCHLSSSHLSPSSSRRCPDKKISSILNKKSSSMLKHEENIFDIFKEFLFKKTTDFQQMVNTMFLLKRGMFECKRDQESMVSSWRYDWWKYGYVLHSERFDRVIEDHVERCRKNYTMLMHPNVVEYFFDNFRKEIK
jgi:hypothetical protein